MKVFDLVCSRGHRFEGWFASAERYAEQLGAATVRCPLCDSHEIRREPSAPRLASSAAAPPGVESAQPQPRSAAIGTAMLDRLRRAFADIENVGPRFAEEARRIHYEEVPVRPIRGIATERERRALHDEGIETLAIAVPAVLTETMQ